MKIMQSSAFRAVCAVVIGVLLIKYREQTVEWITIAIGILFFLSGVVSVATYLSARSRADMPEVFDADGRQLTGLKPTVPIVGIGSLILGIILALMPTTFIAWLMYILSAILILGAINQFVSLAAASRYARVGIYFWVMPSLILLVALLSIVYPTAIASAPLLIIGWCMVVYGVADIINALKLSRLRRNILKGARQQAAGKTADNKPSDGRAES
ncbi:MAG: DUF308 domain-containing protein [Prevotella sp.]|nr:DUF308 domain-containing protein [Prevotella sp.]